MQDFTSGCQYKQATDDDAISGTCCHTRTMPSTQSHIIKWKHTQHTKKVTELTSMSALNKQYYDEYIFWYF